MPLALLRHLAHVERRWIRWGFSGEQLDEPWGDHMPERGRWRRDPDETLAEITAFFHERCAHTRSIVAGARLEDQSALGGRFGLDEDRPTLIWILFHLLQEDARHVGQLDVARELADGSIGTLAPTATVVWSGDARAGWSRSSTS